MAKMDRYEQLPKIFKDNNVVLFPINRRGYAIVKGKGYHELEEISERPAIHVTEYPMPQSIADFESEQVFLNRAYSTGLLERFAKHSGLSAPLQIRIDTPAFDFKLDKSTISVDRAQVEIDAVTENPETLIIIEAKIGYHLPSIYVRFTILSELFFKNRRRLEIFFFVLTQLSLFICFGSMNLVHTINLMILD